MLSNLLFVSLIIVSIACITSRPLLTFFFCIYLQITFDDISIKQHRLIKPLQVKWSWTSSKKLSFHMHACWPYWKVSSVCQSRLWVFFFVEKVTQSWISSDRMCEVSFLSYAIALTMHHRGLLASKWWEVKVNTHRWISKKLFHDYISIKIWL